MKRILLILTTLTLTYLAKAQDQLYNPSFNMWTVNTVATQPTSWMNSYHAFGIMPTTPMAVEKSSDASNLTSSVKLNTVGDPMNPTFGFVLLGSIGNNGPQGGVPFTLSADSIVFDAKYDLQAGDSANVILMMKLNGVPFEMKMIAIGGTHTSSWQRMAYKINPLNVTPDSLLLGFTSSNTNNGNPVVGSWFQLDNIRFVDGNTTSSPIPNPSFENWSDITTENCNEWFTMNTMFAAITNTATVTKSTDAQEGTYAMQLRPDSVDMGGSMNFLQAMAIYGTMDMTGGGTPKGKPFLASPTSVSGYYKWAPQNGATGSFSVTLQAAGVPVATGNFSFSAAQSSYAQFTVPLTVSAAPDTVIIMIDGGSQAGSVLLVDNIRFAGGNVGVKTISLMDATVSVFPNPTNGDATLKVALPKPASVSYTVMNALGQVVESENLGSMKDGIHGVKLGTANYSTGVYFVKVKIGDDVMTQKVIVK